MGVVSNAAAPCIQRPTAKPSLAHCALRTPSEELIPRARGLWLAMGFLGLSWVLRLGRATCPPGGDVSLSPWKAPGGCESLPGPPRASATPQPAHRSVQSPWVFPWAPSGPSFFPRARTLSYRVYRVAAPREVDGR